MSRINILQSFVRSKVFNNTYPVFVSKMWVSTSFVSCFILCSCFFFSDLFSTVIDMLATLIHSTLVSDTQNEKGEENRKHYQNLMKKLKKVTLLFSNDAIFYGQVLGC